MRNRTRITGLILVLFLLSTGTIAAYQSLSNTIIIVDDGKVTQYETVEGYVGEVLASEGIELGDKDQITPSLDTEIENGMKIEIERFQQTVHLVIDGRPIEMKTGVSTVEELLTKLNIQLGEQDIITPELTEEIVDGLVIEIKTKQVYTQTVEEAIPFETTVEYSAEVPYGQREVIVQGEEGVKEQQIEVVRFGEDVLEETIISEEIISEPKTEIVREGIKNSIVDPDTGNVYEYTEVMQMEATAYTHQPGDRWYNQTASGMPTFVGMVAVDRSVIPLGTVLYVEDYGIAIAGDVGGAVKGDIVDLYFDTTSEVYEFGRQQREVYILSDQTIDVMVERGVK